MSPIRENQTKVGLKSRSLSATSEYCGQRKSDQGGIEILYTAYQRISLCVRKSDQGGIEIVAVLFCSEERLGENQTKVGLKYFLGYCGGFNPCGENQTKVGLKFPTSSKLNKLKTEKIRPRWDWNHAEHRDNECLWFEKIRPRWDWNYLSDAALKEIEDTRENQTKVGLKYYCSSSSMQSSRRENQTKVGLKCRKHRIPRTSWNPRKSDQGGIEMRS